MTELKPCPLCGDEVRILGPFEPVEDRGHTYRWTIACSCASQDEPEISDLAVAGDDQEQLIAAWNRRADGWVSVEERLPAFSGYFLGYNPTPSKSSHRIWFDKNNGRFDTKRLVTHWQPLPAPPEPKP